MKKFYVIDGISPFLDGCIVEAEYELTSLSMSVSTIINPDVNIGGKLKSFPVTQNCMLLHKDFLTEVENPLLREFAADNPYGKFVLEGRMDYGNLRVTYAEFEKVMTVTVLDTQTGKTVISQNFSRDFENVKDAIEDALKNGDEGGEDLVFKLQELKEAENNG